MKSLIRWVLICLTYVVVFAVGGLVGIRRDWSEHISKKTYPSRPITFVGR